MGGGLGEGKKEGVMRKIREVVEYSELRGSGLYRGEERLNGAKEG